jgi:hypothetical protein
MDSPGDQDRTQPKDASQNAAACSVSTSDMTPIKPDFSPHYARDARDPLYPC